MTFLDSARHRMADTERRLRNTAVEYPTALLGAMDDFMQLAALAWERDMLPVRDALVAAVHAGDLDSLRELKERLPDLLDQVNEDPALAGVLHQQLFKVAAATLSEKPADRITNTASVEQWRGRTLFPTEFSSRDLRGLSSELHLRSIFSARTTNADYLAEVGQTVDDLLSGKSNLADGRLRLMRKLKQLGYDPEKGFPQDMASVPPAEKDSLRDLSSRQRLDLMLRTNLEMTRNYTRVVQGNSETMRRMFPAWELRRVASRVTPRGTPDTHTVGWLKRFEDAAASVGWEGVSKEAFAEGRMVARKDSPVWQALGDGVGGYEDTLGHNYGPFAFNSGFDLVATPRAEWEKLAGEEPETRNEKPETGPMQATLAPTPAEVKARFAALPPDLRAKLLERWSA